MAFTERDIASAWTRAGAICECTSDRHGHEGRCHEKLFWRLQGGDLAGGWRACRKASWGTDVLQNCEIRCVKCQGVMIRPVE